MSYDRMSVAGDEKRVWASLPPQGCVFISGAVFPNGDVTVLFGEGDPEGECHSGFVARRSHLPTHL